MTNMPPEISSIDIQVPHRNWNNALAESFALLVAAQPGDVVCITGPSRTGKTRLKSELCKLLSGDGKFEDTGYMACVEVEAANTGPNGTFSTKFFMHRMLEAIKHPIFSTANTDFNNPDSYQRLMRASEAQLRLAFERGLIWRKARYLIIDEAQHAKYSSKGTHAGHALMDSWKCLAQATNTILVIVGAYPILEILRGSPHLLGRKHQVHLQRYYETIEDLEEFGLILAHYDQVVELGKGVNSLQDYIEILYEGTFGCIGLLRGWLTRSNAISKLRGGGITKKILLESILSRSDLKDIWIEIAQGEKLIDKSDHYLLNDNAQQISIESGENNVPKNKLKPFKRKPKRIKKDNRTDTYDDE